MTTEIISNGSKCSGEQPDSIETLLEVLSKNTLDPTFERYGNFVIADEHPLEPGVTRFWGNFLNLSHVFSIDSDDPEVVEKLTTAIRANQGSKQYQNARTDAAFEG